MHQARPRHSSLLPQPRMPLPRLPNRQLAAITGQHHPDHGDRNLAATIQHHLDHDHRQEDTDEPTE